MHVLCWNNIYNNIPRWRVYSNTLQVMLQEPLSGVNASVMHVAVLVCSAWWSVWIKVRIWEQKVNNFWRRDNFSSFPPGSSPLSGWFLDSRNRPPFCDSSTVHLTEFLPPQSECFCPRTLSLEVLVEPNVCTVGGVHVNHCARGSVELRCVTRQKPWGFLEHSWS